MSPLPHAGAAIAGPPQAQTQLHRLVLPARLAASSRMSQPSRISRRGVPANLLELPMHLAFTSWAAILMGMSGHDLRTFYMLRKHLDATPAASSLRIEANGMTAIDTCVL